MTLKHNQSGMTLVSALVALGILSVAALLMMRNVSNLAAIKTSDAQNTELEAIRRTILNDISCDQTMFRGGVAQACSGFIDLRRGDDSVIIPATGRLWGGWTLVAKCEANIINVWAAKLKPDGTINAADDDDQFIIDPLTKKPMNWSFGAMHLFPSNASPCEITASPDKLKSVVYTAPGSHTYTVPEYVYTIIVELWGGGGGSGSAAARSTYPREGGYTFYNYSLSGYGGGGGAYAKQYFAVKPGDKYTLTVGAGGAGGAGCGHGAAGGHSTFKYSPSLTIWAGGGSGGLRAWDWTAGHQTADSQFSAEFGITGPAGGAPGDPYTSRGEGGNAPRGGTRGIIPSEPGGGANGPDPFGIAWNTCRAGYSGANGRIVIWEPTER